MHRAAAAPSDSLSLCAKAGGESIVLVARGPYRQSFFTFLAPLLRAIAVSTSLSGRAGSRKVVEGARRNAWEIIYPAHVTTHLEEGMGRHRGDDVGDSLWTISCPRSIRAWVFTMARRRERFVVPLHRWYCKYRPNWRPLRPTDAGLAAHPASDTCQQLACRQRAVSNRIGRSGPGSTRARRAPFR